MRAVELTTEYAENVGEATVAADDGGPGMRIREIIDALIQYVASLPA